MEITLQDDLGGLIRDLHEQGYAFVPSNQKYPLTFTKENRVYALLYPGFPSKLTTEHDDICEIAKKYKR